MKICLAQINSRKGDISENIILHEKWIKKAVQHNVDIICFPELSLSSYEPRLAESLAFTIEDVRLTVFQQLSNRYKVTLLIGAPTLTESKPNISQLIFQPHRKLKLYSKQLLHADERLYFSNGKEDQIIEVNHKKVAPAICYEALQPEHLASALKNKPDLYLASVAKDDKGVRKALKYFPVQAKNHNLPILMCNSVGHCDNFQSKGSSSIWNSKGELIAQLDDNKEGLLFYDT